MRSNEKGSVLIASTIVTLVVMAGVVEYSFLVSRMSRTNVRAVTSQKALVNAESGLESALQFLRTPEASAKLQAGLPYTLSFGGSTTNYAVDLIRNVANP